MPPTETLNTLAEVAATFVGFAGLAAIIGHRSGVVPQVVSYVRVHAVIVWGLIVLAFSLLPALTVEFFETQEQMFTFLSATLVLAFIVHELFIDVRLIRLWKQGEYRMQLGFWLMLIIPLVTIVLAAANAAGAFSYQSYVVYTFCVGLGLAQASLVLLRLFLAFVPRSAN